MKTLFIVRHAKSSWEDPQISDHDRPLLAVGVKKTKRISNFLVQKNVLPELMLSSTAVRAFETARLIAAHIGYPEDQIKSSSNLYHAGSGDIFTELYAIENTVDSVMIFGHNPTLTYFANQYLDPRIENLPTSGLVSIEFGCDKWEDINDSKFQVNFVVFPRMLK